MNKKPIHIILLFFLPIAFITANAQNKMPDTVCVGTTRTYKVNDASTPSTYTWKIDSVVQSSVKNEMVITWMKPGRFLITVQEHSLNGCDGEIQSGYVYVDTLLKGMRYPTISAIANVAKQLFARNLGSDYTYHWTPSIGLNYFNIRTPVFKYDRSMDYVIRISSINGCAVVDSLKVLVVAAAPLIKSSLHIPNAFTPNDDGLNDKLLPLVIGMKEISFKVLNRWGQLVFETNTLNEGWDGKLNGIPQSAGVYVWMVTARGMDGDMYQQSGTAVLIR